MVLHNCAAHQGDAFFGSELYVPQLEMRNRGSIQPRVVEPGKRPLVLVPQRLRELGFEYRQHLFCSYGFALVFGTECVESTHKWILRVAPARLRWFCIAEHGAKHVEHPCAAAITDRVVCPWSFRGREAQPEGDW